MPGAECNQAMVKAKGNLTNQNGCVTITCLHTNTRTHARIIANTVRIVRILHVLTHLYNRRWLTPRQWRSLLRTIFDLHRRSVGVYSAMDFILLECDCHLLTSCLILKIGTKFTENKIFVPQLSYFRVPSKMHCWGRIFIDLLFTICPRLNEHNTILLARIIFYLCTKTPF